MRKMMRRVSCVLLTLCILVVITGNASATKVADSTVDLSANNVSAVVTDIADFSWSIIGDGASITITVDVEIDDNNVAVNFVFSAHIAATQNDSMGQYKANQGDEWHNPNAPNPDNSAIWPLGRFAYKTLSVTFNDLDAGDTIDCHTTVDAVNFAPNPDATSQDGEWTRITIVP